MRAAALSKVGVLGAVLTLVGHIGTAQITVYFDDYNNRTPGSDFPAWNWGSDAVPSPQVTFEEVGEGNIVVNELGQVQNTGQTTLNGRYGSKWDITLSGNTSTRPEDYTIEFDIRGVEGQWDPLDLQVYVLTKESEGDYGRGFSIQITNTGEWVHVSRNLSELTIDWWQGTSWNLTNPNWSIEIGGPPWPGSPVEPGQSWTQLWQFDNLKITMVPEPWSGVALALGGIIVTALRRFQRK